MRKGRASQKRKAMKKGKKSKVNRGDYQERHKRKKVGSCLPRLPHGIKRKTKEKRNREKGEAGSIIKKG